MFSNLKLYFVIDPCSEHDCADGGVCQLNEARQPVCRCGPPCDLVVKAGSAVCGSDYKDYPSECALRRESCRTRQQLTIAYRGECASGNWKCIFKILLCSDTVQLIIGLDYVEYVELYVDITATQLENLVFGSRGSWRWIFYMSCVLCEGAIKSFRNCHTSAKRVKVEKTSEVCKLLALDFSTFRFRTSK